MKFKAALQRKWLLSRRGTDKREYTAQRDIYKKAVKVTKDKYSEDKITEAIDDNPLHRTWKLVTRRQTLAPKSNLLRRDIYKKRRRDKQISDTEVLPRRQSCR